MVKNEPAAAALPSREFGANAAWLRLNVLFYNLLSAFKRVALPEQQHDAPPKRLLFVLLNGVMFGAFHLSFETVIRFLPTAWLGIVIAWAVWRTASIWTGVLMHLVNNASIVLLASMPSSGGGTAASIICTMPSAGEVASSKAA